MSPYTDYSRVGRQVLIREDVKVLPFAEFITKAALSTSVILRP
jgi:hypothetical protein